MQELAVYNSYYTYASRSWRIHCRTRGCQIAHLYIIALLEHFPSYTAHEPTYIVPRNLICDSFLSIRCSLN